MVYGKRYMGIYLYGTERMQEHIRALARFYVQDGEIHTPLLLQVILDGTDGHEKIE